MWGFPLNRYSPSKISSLMNVCIYTPIIFGGTLGAHVISIEQLHKEPSCSLSRGFSFISLKRRTGRVSMFVQDPSCWNGLLESLIIWNLEKKLTLSEQLFLILNFLRDLQCKIKRCMIPIKLSGIMEGKPDLFCFSGFLEIDFLVWRV